MQTQTITVVKTQEEKQTITITQAPGTTTVTKTQVLPSLLSNLAYPASDTNRIQQEQEQTITITAAPNTITVTKQQQQEETTTVFSTKQEKEIQTVYVTKEQVKTVVVPTCSTSKTTMTSTGCPTNLPTNYQAPHLIVPVNKSSPSTEYGTSFDGEITPSISTLFNFDIPPSYSGQDCSLIFALPTQAQLQTSSFTLSGPGIINFALLSAPVTKQTTYASAPAVANDYGNLTVVPGNAYTIASFACPAGKSVSFELSSLGGTSLTFFEDFNPCPIGLFITEMYGRKGWN